MATQQTLSSRVGGADAPKRSPMTGVWIVLAAAVVLGLVAYHARTGAVSPRIANPAVVGAPRPVEFGHGSEFPIREMQWGTVGMMVILVAACVRAWRRQPGHPY